MQRSECVQVPLQAIPNVSFVIGGCGHTTVLHAHHAIVQPTKRTLPMRHRERFIAAIQWLAENLALRELLRSISGRELVVLRWAAKRKPQ